MSKRKHYDKKGNFSGYSKYDSSTGKCRHYSNAGKYRGYSKGKSPVGSSGGGCGVVDDALSYYILGFLFLCYAIALVCKKIYE